MAGYLLRRGLHLVLVLLLVTVAVSALLDLMPGDPALTILGTTASKADVAALDHQLGLDRPFAVRYASWLAASVHGDLGQSVITKQPVLQAIEQGLPITLEIVALALVIALAVAVPVAAYCARRPGGATDVTATGLSSVLLSLPAFVGGIVLLYLLAVVVPVVPVGGWVAFTEDPAANLHAAILPAVVIALGPCAGFFRVLRADMITTLQQDFVLTARAKGLPTRYILLRHALRPSLFTLVTTAGLTVGGLISASFIVDVIFQLPGLGNITVQAINTKDIPIVQGVTVFIAFVYVAANAVVDLTYAVLDPRVQRP